LPLRASDVHGIDLITHTPDGRTTVFEIKSHNRHLTTTATSSRAARKGLASRPPPARTYLPPPLVTGAGRDR
jgi:hypothetical protein